MFDLKLIARSIHENARAKGWWEKNRNMGEMLMLVVSEVSEAMEADRVNKFSDWKFDDPPIIYPERLKDEDFKSLFESKVKNTFEDELADTIIRILDICHARNIDIEWHIKNKMRYNTLRPFKHGGKKY